jgi:hypothetical protein
MHCRHVGAGLAAFVRRAGVFGGRKRAVLRLCTDWAREGFHSYPLAETVHRLLQREAQLQSSEITSGEEMGLERVM